MHQRLVPTDQDRSLSAPRAQMQARSPSPRPTGPLTTGSEGTPPLSLKVMRLSRPTLAHVSPHFFEGTSSDPLSAALQARIEGSPLHHGLSPSASSSMSPSFHPATMRDFPLSSLPTLPGSFGAISLGETFTAALCLSNDSTFDVSHVRLRAEMQTSTAKILLSEATGPDETGGGVDRGQVLPMTIKWEIKELGLHVLACDISWFDDETQGERSFRKVYKFQVNNPLSVKTKVHIPHSPTASLSPTDRNLLFLELHVQNTSPLPITFSDLKFEPAEGLTFRSMNSTQGIDGPGIWEDESGQGPVLLPRDVRQICWIVDETNRPGTIGEGGIKTVWEPGTILPLGKMDIYWTTAYGEPGHLQTSTLNRRIPIPPPAPASNLGPHLVRSSSNRPGSAHSLPTSPPSNPPTLPTLPNSPSVTRTDSQPISAPRPRRLQELDVRRSGTMSLPPTPPPKDLDAPPPPPPAAWTVEDWSIDLTITDRPSRVNRAVVEEVFKVQLRCAFKPSTSDAQAERSFELQHLQPESGQLQALGSSLTTFSLPLSEGVSVKEWTLEYLALRGGLSILAGLRLVVVEEGEKLEGRREKEVARWDTLGEILVSG